MHRSVLIKPKLLSLASAGPVRQIIIAGSGELKPLAFALGESLLQNNKEIKRKTK